MEEVDGRKLVVLWAPGGQTRPYKVPAAVTAKNKVWHYYIRRYTSTVQAKGDDEQELLSLAAKVPFDDRFCQTARVADLSQPLMVEFLNDIGSELAGDANARPLEALARQLNVLGGASEAPWPKNVGLLFFNEAPKRFFPATQIDVVWFPEGAGGDRFEEKSFKGPLGRMTREALDYIRRNYLVETVIKHPQRAESERVWNWPYGKLRRFPRNRRRPLVGGPRCALFNAGDGTAVVDELVELPGLVEHAVGAEADAALAHVERGVVGQHDDAGLALQQLGVAQHTQPRAFLEEDVDDDQVVRLGGDAQRFQCIALAVGRGDDADRRRVLELG